MKSLRDMGHMFGILQVQTEIKRSLLPLFPKNHSRGFLVTFGVMQEHATIPYTYYDVLEPCLLQNLLSVVARQMSGWLSIMDTNKPETLQCYWLLKVEGTCNCALMHLHV